MNNQIKYELYHESNSTFILPKELECEKNGTIFNPFNENFLAHFSPYMFYSKIAILPDWRPDKFTQPRYFRLKPTHFICEFIAEDNPNNKDFDDPEFRKAKTIVCDWSNQRTLVGKYVFERVLNKQESKNWNHENLSDKAFKRKMEAMFNKSKK